MKEIPLSQGKVALVDDADFESVSQFHWHLSQSGHNFYVRRHLPVVNGKKSRQYLHHFLMPESERIDHIDGNGCNDQRHNLRDVTNQENCRGFQRKRPNSLSEYRGVSWYPPNGKWRANITVNGRNLYLGFHSTEIEAAIARDIATLKHYGPDAHFNFPVDNYL